MLLATLLALVHTSCSGSSSARRPDLLLITIDTLRADRLTPYGYAADTSPFLATLAADGIVFENAIAQCGTTPQSLSSLMTGLYPFTDRLLTKNDVFVYLRRRPTTLARALGDLGYQTHAITSSIQSSRVTGIESGFETFDGIEVDEARPRGSRRRAAAEMTDRAADWLRQRSDDRPFFLWLHYLDPHYPYDPPEAYAHLFENREPGVEGEERFYRFDEEQSKQYPLSDGELQRLSLDYEREIRSVDDSLARLFGGSDLERFLDRSVVIVSADHGEALGEHGIITHNDLYESIVRVPLIFRLPDRRHAGRRIAEPVMLVDLFATVHDLLDLPLRVAVRGASLAGLVGGGEGPGSRLRLAEYSHERAIYLEGVKLIARRGGSELYDLVRDPAELRDLSAGDEGLSHRLLAAYDRIERRDSRQGDQTEDLPEVTPAMVDELRSLGYL